MSTNPYGVDPEVLQYSTLAPRSAPAVGIGLGSPREFPFKQGQPLDSSWTTSQTDPAWTIEPHDGFLRFQAQNVQMSRADVTIARPFSLDLASVTIAFKLRVNDVSLQGGGFRFEFAPGLSLNLTPNFAHSYAYVDQDAQQERLGPSNITADGTWHRIVITIQPGVVTIWEDDQHVVTWTPVQPLGATVQASFGVATSGATASIDLSDVAVLVGTTQRARLRMAVSDESNFSRRINYLSALTSFVPDILTAAKPVLDLLDATDVGLGDLFWGIDVKSSVPGAVQQLGQHPSVSRLTTAARASAGNIPNHSPVFYIGINLSASFIVSGAASTGFLIGTGDDPYTLWTFAVNGGGVTNAGIQGTAEVGVFWLPPRDLLGFGGSLQVDAGEFFQGSLGVSGNIPLDLSGFINCGPALTFGVGVSGLPGDIGGSLSYTWNLARL